MRISPRTGGDARPGHALAQHPTAFLHVANGTSTTGTIHDAGIPGESSIWADPLHDGPVPAGASDEELLEIRARHLAGEEHGVEANVGGLRRWRQIIDDHRAYDEIVLWYEHDLFDQLNLIQVLSRLAGPGSWPKPVSLICIGSFPGRPRFKGLGELTASELGPLFETRQPVTAAQYAVAVSAWAAFRAPEPTVDRSISSDRHVRVAVSRRGPGAAPRGVPIHRETDSRAPSIGCSSSPRRRQSRCAQPSRGCTTKKPRITSPIPRCSMLRWNCRLRSRRC